MNSTDIFLEHIFSLKKEKIPKSVYQQAQNCLLDYFGVTYAGASLLNEKISNYINCFDGENGSSVLIGFDRKASQSAAAVINGLSAHAAELDDGHRQGMIHLGATIISALLTVGNHWKTTGKDFLFAIIVGYESAVKLARYMQPEHKMQGYHTTGTCGTVGAALAIGALMGFDRTKMKNALSAAATGAAGILEIQEDDSDMKPYNAGRAVQDGISAAYMAAAGFTGPEDILSGKRGLFRAMAPGCDFKKSINSGKIKYEIEGVYKKMYASCRHSHSAVEVVIDLKNKKSLNIEELQRIDIYTYSMAVNGHDHKVIKNDNSAKMSIPYSVAVALRMGHLDIGDFGNDIINNEKILDLIQKIHIYEDIEMTLQSPLKRAARVVVRTKENKVYTGQTEYTKGEPENPFTQEELRNKYMSLMQYSGRSEEYASVLMNYVVNIERDFNSLMDFL